MQSGRERAHLGHRYAAMLAAVGTILKVGGAILLLPLLVGIADPAELRHGFAFAVPAGALLLVGFLLRRAGPGERDASLSLREGRVIVVTGWVVVMTASAWPFMSISGLPFSRALFEAVSGWTTTGLSVIDLTAASRSELLWRSVMQLAGGAGLAILMMSAIVGPTGIGIASAEGRSEQLAPQVRESSRLVLILYSSYAALGGFAYWLAGMSPFDALNHAFCAVSTGGFSTRPASLGHWDSPAIELVTVVLMLLGSLSFVTAWALWRGRLGVARRSAELRLFALLAPVFVVALFAMRAAPAALPAARTLRVVTFQTLATFTTTGFATTDMRGWSSFGLLILIVMMVIGGGTCSSAGGLKQLRVVVLWKLMVWELRRLVLPRTAVIDRSLWEGEQRVSVDEEKLRQVGAFAFLYLLAYVLGVAALCACGFSLSDAAFEFASALGTVGLSVGVTSAAMPDLALWSEICGMVLGRLEIVVVIVSVLQIARDLRLATRLRS